MKQQRTFGRIFLAAFVGLMYLFLYAPIIMLIIFSFNAGESSIDWTGFSLRWYQELWESPDILDALYNSLIVAFSSVVLSLIMGVLIVYYAERNFLDKILPLFYISLAIPEIVLAVGLLSLFSSMNIPLGFMTLIVGHTVIGLGYVVPIVYVRYTELDYRLTEASLDLGATQSQTFWRIILPLLSPALFASGLLVFIISLDDFIFSFFCSGASVQTLPLLIFSIIRAGASPLVNALSTMLLVISSLVVLLYSALQLRGGG